MGPLTALTRAFGRRPDSNTFAARHARLARGYGSRPDPADPRAVAAMQLVLRIEKTDPPRREDLLAAAAAATVALCMDERCGPGGEWEDPLGSWLDARIRKVARRARGKAWADVQDIPGVTVTVGGAQVRALVPGPVGALDKAVRKLQISGTDLPGATDPAPVDPAAVAIWVDGALGMSVGKAAAQVGHGAMMLATAMSAERMARWAADDYRTEVRTADADRWDRLHTELRAGRAVSVRDAGFTEVAPGAETVIALPGTLPDQDVSRARD